jgi:hypothetical protein
MIAPHIIERARTLRIEDECARRSIHLRGGPCPVCGGHDRFAINIRKQVFLCRVCDVAGDVIKLVQHIDAYTFAQVIEILTGEEARPQALPPAAPKKQSIAEYEREQRRKARWLWAQCQPITGSIAERYLRARGITCPLPATLGFLPARGEHPPAMTAAFGLCDEPDSDLIVPPDSVGSVHLTLLAPNGSVKADVKKPKLVVGRFRGDVTTPLLGRDLIVEAKSRARFAQLYRWIDGADVLVLQGDHQQPLVVVRLRFALDVDVAAERGRR